MTVIHTNFELGTPLTEKNKTLNLAVYHNSQDINRFGNTLMILTERGRTNFEIEDILNHFTDEEINKKLSNNKEINFTDGYGKENFYLNSSIENKAITIENNQKPTNKDFNIIIVGNVLLEKTAYPMLPENKIFIKIPLEYFFYVDANNFINNVYFQDETSTSDEALTDIGVLFGFKDQNLTITTGNNYIHKYRNINAINNHYIKLFAKDFYEFDKQEIYLSDKDFIRNPDEVNDPIKNFGWYIVNPSITYIWLIKRNKFGNIIYRDSNNYMKIDAQFDQSYIDENIEIKPPEIIHNKKRVKREVINIDKTIKDTYFGSYTYKDSELYGSSFFNYSTNTKYVKINNQELIQTCIKNTPKILSVQKSSNDKNGVVLRVQNIINTPGDYNIYTAGYQNNGVIISGKTPKARNGKISNLAPVDLGL